MHDPSIVGSVRGALVFLLVIPVLLGSGALVHVQAQSSNDLDVDGPPYYGTTELKAGFPDDPHTVAVRAGGIRTAEELGADCVGSIGVRPDLRVHYEADDALPLNIYAVADGDDDLSLIIRKPDGSWVCNSAFEGPDPAILLDDPLSGRYDIWVGGVNADYADGKLHISELPPRF